MWAGIVTVSRRRLPDAPAVVVFYGSTQTVSGTKQENDWMSVLIGVTAQSGITPCRWRNLCRSCDPLVWVGVGGGDSSSTASTLNVSPLGESDDWPTFFSIHTSHSVTLNILETCPSAPARHSCYLRCVAVVGADLLGRPPKPPISLSHALTSLTPIKSLTSPSATAHQTLAGHYRGNGSHF